VTALGRRGGVLAGPVTRIRHLARRLLAAVWPPARRAERTARQLARMPRRHPESLTRTLPPRQEQWLTTVCEDLWPQLKHTGKDPRDGAGH
jgi:hypothetical protein